MNKKIRLAAAIAVFASFAGLVYLAVSEYRAKSIIKSTPVMGKGISGKIENVHYSSTHGGKTDWELDAKTAVRRKSDDAVALETVVMLIHSKSGEVYTLTARDAVYRQSAAVVDASGGVTVATKAGITMKTESVEYSAKSKKATTDNAVRISSENMTVTGSGLVMEPDKGRFSLLRNVKAIIRDKAK